MYALPISSTKRCSPDPEEFSVYRHGPWCLNFKENCLVSLSFLMKRHPDENVVCGLYSGPCLLLFLPKMGDAGGRTWQHHLKKVHTHVNETHVYCCFCWIVTERFFASVQCCIIRMYPMSFLNRGRLYKVQISIGKR